MAKKKQVRSRGKNFTTQEKLNTMMVIEQHDGSVANAADALGIHHTTLYKWKAQYWEEYVENKENVANNMLTIQAQKMVLFTGTNELVNKSTKLFEKAIEFFMEDENFEKLNGRDKITMVNVILPYVLEKKVVSGVKEKTPAQQNNFFANVYNQMKIQDNGEHSGTNQGNIAPASVTGE